MKASLFVYIQELYTFFAPPFSAIFLLGTLWRRVSGRAATITVFVGFALGVLVKLWANSGAAPVWLEPYANQGILNWASCMVICALLSLVTARPRPEQITDDLALKLEASESGRRIGCKMVHRRHLLVGSELCGNGDLCGDLRRDFITEPVCLETVRSRQISNFYVTYKPTFKPLRPRV